MNSQKLKTTLKKIETLGFSPNRFCNKDEQSWIFCPEKAHKADAGLCTELISLTNMFKDMLLDDLGNFQTNRDIQSFLNKHNISMQKNKENKYVTITYRTSEVNRIKLPL